MRNACVMAGFSVLLALVVGAGGCEILARVFLRGGLSDRVEILEQDGGLQADCYPAARGVKMAYDLREPQQGVAFFRRFHRMQIGWPGSTVLTREQDPLSPTESMEEALTLLRERAPICQLYDTRAESPRFLDEPPGFQQSMALLGDSFTFGQGLPDADVLPAKLAAKTHWRVRSYAVPGANISEIVGQFAKAMKDRVRYRFRHIVYMYVPNDPILSDELRERTNLLNDLMNVRLSATPYSSRAEVRFLGKLAPHSALAAAILRTYSARVVARRTLRFYQDAHDPAKNDGFRATFEQIRQMREQAEAAGIDFVVAAFPLMLDMQNYPIPDVNRHLATEAERVGVTFFDLLPAFRAKAAVSYNVHPIDLHPNAAAQDLVSTALAEFLLVRERELGERHGVLPHVLGPGTR